MSIASQALVEPGEEPVPGVELPQREDLGLVPPLARAWRGRHARLAAAVVDEVELELCRDDGRQPSAV
jgi:hypothetical protein